MTATPKPMTIETIDRQKEYVAIQRQKGHGLGIVFADAFIRGMRDIGYKDPAWALAELVDNSVQAAAENISIRLGFAPENSSQAKPDMLAICDDGNGMIPEMIGFAVRWGGTDREGDRNGFGRYGYGLPSSAVSIARRYTVYSKTTESDWHAVTVDIKELADVAGDLAKTEALLTARPAQLPSWLLDAEDNINLSNLKSGTIVVFEDPDRLRTRGGWITTNTLKTKLLQRFGVIYHHWIPDRRLYVHGALVQVVDPLFLMEHGRFFDETSVRAIRVETRTFDVENSEGKTGTVTVRAALLPPNFQLADPTQYGRKGAKLNNRYPIMKEYNGLLISRERRVIDCIPPRWTKFQNYDANVKVEIDFEPELDEYFGITTSKQQIVIADEMWEKLQHSGKGGGALVDLVADIRTKFDDMGKEFKANANNQEQAGEPRPSVLAMEESEKLKGSTPQPTPDQQDEANKNLREEAKARAQYQRKPEQQVLEELRAEVSSRRWEVEFASIPEGPFYRPKRLGEQKRLIINTDHPFYTKVYDVAPNVRAALEVLLFVLAERELEASGGAELFYKAERQRWSERLRQALDSLIAEQDLVDTAAAMAEKMHATVVEAPEAAA